MTSRRNCVLFVKGHENVKGEWESEEQEPQKHFSKSYDWEPLTWLTPDERTEAQNAASIVPRNRSRLEAWMKQSDVLKSLQTIKEKMMKAMENGKDSKLDKCVLEYELTAIKEKISEQQILQDQS